ncbi:hypothetical protein Bca52824_065634 [Brassica carinata]|uniref:Uncharacterized protein n=1 Tax=Brassica carinata TaxID=52824 RepID=A0A8X7UA64_BRACI|nr:hypothetical protein Bca52824_065634 [Brassica carinata]
MGRVAFKVLMDSVKGRDISVVALLMGFASSRIWVYTALRNWVLIMVNLSQTICLHRSWLTRVAKDADSLKRLSSVGIYFNLGDRENL